MYNKLSLEDIKEKIKDNRVLIRVDFNVPIKNGIVQDTNRIKQSIPTIEYCLANGAKGIVLISHLGRPDGIKDPKYSLKPVAQALEVLMKRKISFLDDCVGDYTIQFCKNIKDGQIVLLENVRFYLEEEGEVKDSEGKKRKAKPDDVYNFRKQLSQLGDLYVNDAFACSHRAHSSMVGIDLPYKVAGLLVIKEINSFANVLENAKRPFVLIMGGAKVKDKIKLITNMLEKIDDLVIGGGIALTFLKFIKGMKIGNSICDYESVDIVKEIVVKAEENEVNIHFPVDFVCSKSKFGETPSEVKVFDIENGIDEGWAAYDIGPKSVERFAEVFLKARTVVWNGPPGVLEQPEYQKGTIGMMNSLIKTQENGGFVVIGGGETVMATKLVPGSYDKIAHVSTGGGASLELLEGSELPGVVNLTNKC
jgi:phosphoglycerate kinase